MKKTILIALILIVVAGSVSLYYFKFKSEKLDEWSFVPADALAVYETNNFVENWKSSAQKKIWKNLLNTPALSSLNENIELLDTILSSNGGLEKLLANQQVLASVHSISKHDIGFVFTLAVKNIKQHGRLSQLLESFTNRKDIKLETRTYLGHQITELSNEAKTTFSYIFYKNFFIGSFTSFLVEDAIRTVDDSETANYNSRTPQLRKLSVIEQDNGNLYVNASRLGVLGQTFIDPLLHPTNELSSLIDQSLLDVDIADNQIVLTGFSLKANSKPNYLEIFNSSQSSELKLIDIVPNNAAYLLHYSFNDFSIWHKNLKDYWRKVEPGRLTKIGELENRYNLNLDEFYKATGDELGQIVIESGDRKNPDRITCIKTATPEDLLKIFNKISDDSSSEEYKEVYLNSAIRQVDIEEIPSRLFGKPFVGYKTTFYMVYKGYFLLSSSESTLKSLVDNIEAEQTWGKSVKTNTFLNTTNKEANLSLFVNTNRALNLIQNQLNDKWLTVWKDNITIFKQLEYVALQFTHIDGKYYTNIALHHPGSLIESGTNADFNILAETAFPVPLKSKPFPVRNHNDQSLEMIVQDSLNNIYLVSNTGDTLWHRGLEGSINSDVYQLDYYKNNKLQYLFSTTSSVHIIDRTGTYLPGYPINIPGTAEITHLSLIDYDESKKYRIMVSVTDGNHYLLDKNGRVLKGWDPKTLSGTPNEGAFHLRVRSKDYLVFPTKESSISILNRRGQKRPGFPISLNVKLHNPLFVKKGDSPGNTLFTTISDEGELISFGLDGKTKKREHVYRASTIDQYQLTVSSNNRSFVILRKDSQSASVLNKDGDELFKHKYSVSENMRLKHYVFRPDNEVFVITDMDQEFTYLYDKEGQMLHLEPLQTGKEVAMLYYESDNIYKLYCTYKNKLQTITLSR